MWCFTSEVCYGCGQSDGKICFNCQLPLSPEGLKAYQEAGLFLPEDD